MATNNSINSSTNQYLPLSGGTMTGAVDMGSHQLNSVTDPTSAQDAATKNYVDTVAAGLNPKEAVAAATTANLVGTYVNGVSGVGATFTMTATGVQTLDGQTVTVNYNYLLKNQSSGFQNGVYTCTTAGAGGVASIFTRATNYNTAGDMNAGDLIPVISGTANANTAWLQSATITTVGTDNLVFTQFGSSSPLTTTGDLYGYSTTGARIPVGSNTQALYSDSTQSLGVVWDYTRNQLPNSVVIWTDFLNYSSNTSGNDQTITTGTNGTGSAVGMNSGDQVTDGSRLGIVRLSTGTTTSGRANISMCSNSNSGWFSITGGQTILEFDIQIPVLSSAVDRFIFEVGLINEVSIEGPGNAVYFVYEDNVNSGQWQLVSQLAATATTTNTSIAVVAGTWYHLQIIINAAGTSATGYVNGTNIGSVSSNLPAGANSMYPAIALFKKGGSTGTTNVNCLADWMYYRKDFTTPR